MDPVIRVLFALRKIVLPGLLCIVVWGTPVAAQSPPPFYLGAGGGGAINLHSMNRDIYRGSEYCGVFKGGTSIEPGFQALVEFPVPQWMQGLWLSPRLHYNDMSAEITTAAVDQSARVRDPRDSSLVSADRDHRLNVRLVDVGIDVLGKYHIEPSVFVFAGPSLGLLVERTMEHREVILSPPGGTFAETRAPSRTLYSGDIPNGTTMTAALTLGGGIDLDISPSVKVSPELAYSYHFLPITNDHPWSVSQVQFGVLLKFNTASPIPPKDTIAAITPSSTLAARVAITGVDIDHAGQEREVEVPVIRVEEFITREAYPILNSLFFNTGSAELPDRYVQASSADLTSQVLAGKSALEIHHRTLDILGSRLKADPNEKLIIRGYQTSSEAAIDKSLAAKRGQYIAQELSRRWGIAASRVSVESRTVPNSNSQQADEEQQRVDLLPHHPELLDPLIVERIDRTTNPPKLRVRTSAISNAALISQLRIRQDPGFAHVVENPSPVVDVAFGDEMFPSTEQPIIATLEARDELGGTTMVRDTVQVQQLTIRKKRLEQQADVERERYNLITFELDKATLDARSLRILSQIAQDVTPRDTIEVIGYTDVMGEATHNEALSVARANAVRTALESMVAGRAPGIVFRARGAGEMALFDNNLPEGRQLSRTVQISITRPVGI